MSSQEASLKFHSQVVMRVNSVDEMVRKKARGTAVTSANVFGLRTRLGGENRKEKGTQYEIRIGGRGSDKKQHKLLVRFMACPSERGGGKHCQTFDEFEEALAQSRTDLKPPHA